ncbi:Tetratricopeptide repeat 1, putative [Babesia ovata]|uniref:Tetratricopeptide repeat 1, putative n=1 Tax=Babesia ovata TaxID=189622 RepID=A0A2H6KHQ4_9APIC|nr:Tetratricopeptide repeat 1, putative [Babesia ovata]GBE62526.1 Tetratricopeptide repeat 1, putative [Babesia ovata]
MYGIKMSWLRNNLLYVIIFIRCAVSGIVVDLMTDRLPDGVETFHGALSNGGIYRFIRGIEELITDIKYGKTEIEYLVGYTGELVYSHMEDFRVGHERYVKYSFGSTLGNRVVFRSRTVQCSENGPVPKKVSDLINFLRGPILLSLHTTPGIPLHPLVDLKKSKHNIRGYTYKVLSFIRLQSEGKWRIERMKYQFGEIGISEIKHFPLGYTAIFRRECAQYYIFMLDDYYYIHLDDDLEIMVDISHMSKVNGKKADVSWIPSGDVLCNWTPSGCVGSESVLRTLLLSDITRDGNEMTPSSAHASTRHIYILVPTQLKHMPMFQQYATYDASRNTVTYDVDFLISRVESQSRGRLRTTIHMTPRPAVVRSESSSIVLCAVTEDALNYSRAQTPPTEPPINHADDANDSFHLENLIARMIPPGLDPIADLLDASDILVDDGDSDISLSELQPTIVELIPPTLDPEASTVADGIPDMDYSAFGDSSVEGDASEAPIFSTEMNEGLYSPGTIYDETYPDDETYAEDATMEENGSGSGQQLDLSDILIYDDEDDVSSGEFRSLISDLTPTFDQLALPVDHTFAEMEGNAGGGNHGQTHRFAEQKRNEMEPSVAPVASTSIRGSAALPRTVCALMSRPFPGSACGIACTVCRRYRLAGAFLNHHRVDLSVTHSCVWTPHLRRVGCWKWVAGPQRYRAMSDTRRPQSPPETHPTEPDNSRLFNASNVRAMSDDRCYVNDEGDSSKEAPATDDKDASSATLCDEDTLESGGERYLFGRHSPSFLKERGNNAFKDGDYLAARELYTDAILRLEHSDNDALGAQLYCNRAACHIAMEDFDSAVADATEAVMLDRSYVKAYLRRGSAYEKMGMQQKALADLNKAVELDGTIEPQYRDKICKLKVGAEKEFAKEKDEMMGKLKDLGNTLLGKIGLSLDNFKVNKDENTGSYNIQFQN